MTQIPTPVRDLLGAARVPARQAVHLTTAVVRLEVRLLKAVADRVRPGEPEATSWPAPAQARPVLNDPPLASAPVRPAPPKPARPKPAATATVRAKAKASPAPKAKPAPRRRAAPAGDALTRADAAKVRSEEREAETTPDSPGAELHVAPPWEGYAEQTPAEILGRLADVDETTRAMVRLYESTHASREAVLHATEN